MTDQDGSMVLTSLKQANAAMSDGLDAVLSKRNRDGRWALAAGHPGQVHFVMEQTGQPSRWNTLLALRVLKAYPR